MITAQRRHGYLTPAGACQLADDDSHALKIVTYVETDGFARDVRFLEDNVPPHEGTLVADLVEIGGSVKPLDWTAYDADTAAFQRGLT